MVRLYPDKFRSMCCGPTSSNTAHTIRSISFNLTKNTMPFKRSLCFFFLLFYVFYLGSTLKNSFIIIHYSRFKQTVGLYTLQAPSQNLKVTFYGRAVTSLVPAVSHKDCCGYKAS